MLALSICAIHTGSNSIWMDLKEEMKMEMLTNSKKLQALRELLDPYAVAAWLDEVEQHRKRVLIDPPAIRSSSELGQSQPLMTAGELATCLRVSKNSIYECSR